MFFNRRPEGGRNWLLPVGFIGVALTALFIARQYFFVSPDRLYHLAWQKAQENVYDPMPSKDWAAWKHKFDGQMKDDAEAIQRANEMLKALLNDDYTRMVPAEAYVQELRSMEGKFIGIGVALDIEFDAAGEPVRNAAGQMAAKADADGNPVIKHVMAGSPAEKAGLKDGDALKSIGGKSCKDASIEELIGMIAGKEGTAVVLEIVRNGQTLAPVSIVRAQVKQESAVSAKMLDNEIGYIRLDTFGRFDNDDDMKKALESLNQAKAIVLDLRNNGGGLIENALNISSMFVKDGVIVTVKSRIAGNPAKPEYVTVITRVTATDVIEEVSRTDKPGQVKSTSSKREFPYLLAGRPLVVLVNNMSASASEMTSGALHDNNVAVLVGEHTYGKGIGQHKVYMPNGTRLQVTSLRYFTPNGSWLGDAGATRKGLQPDIEVKPNKQRFEPTSESDNQLEEAVKHLKSKL